MRKLTQEDFVPVYMNIRKNAESDTAWPKLVQWTTESPFIYEDMQITATILQRQMTYDSDWEFIVTIKPNDHTLSGDVENPYGHDRYVTEIGSVTLPTEWSFEDAIDAIYLKVDELVSTYV